MERFLIRKPAQSETDVPSALANIFKLKSFRGKQLEIIELVMKNEDVLVLMPTGAGKSLIYQLPACISRGVTIVVSPLLSLIENQVDQLKRMNVKVASLSSQMSKRDRDGVILDLKSKSPSTKLLYVTPEQLKSTSFRTTLAAVHASGNIARLVIDEAHCICEWGFSFRPDYRALNYWRLTHPKIPILALTATATHQVREDIKKTLGLNGLEVTVPPHRSNLYYEVRLKDQDNDPFKDIYSLLQGIYKLRSKRIAKNEGKSPIERVQGVCAIIYCLKKDTCDEVARLLREKNINAASYHAGITPPQRRKILKDWTDTDEYTIDPKNMVDVVVATISFGMGIDKKNVRLLIHWDVSSSFESYYQESGRAGRDNKTSRCILYYSRKDGVRAAFFATPKESGSKEGNPHSEMKMRSMSQLLQYCENDTVCRHALISKYFESNEKIECKSQCDVCKYPDRVKNMIKSLYPKEELDDVVDKDIENRRDANSTEHAESLTTTKRFKSDNQAVSSVPSSFLQDTAKQTYSGFRTASSFLKDTKTSSSISKKTGFFRKKS